MRSGMRGKGWVAIGAAALWGCASTSTQPGPADMTFFVTSANPGKGANLGGLAGADQHCQVLAAAAGAGGRTWRAYLSTQAPSLTDPNYVNARDRIGTGPWRNAKGVLIARDVNELQRPASNLNKQTALDERGQLVNGRGDNPNEHDILTGSRTDGTAFGPQTDTTCGNWTKNGDGSAVVGHHDRTGLVPDAWARSWNFSHGSAGCSQQALVRTGGSGRFYCFAAN